VRQGRAAADAWGPDFRMTTSLDTRGRALKTLVINLRRRPDRRTYMQEQLDQLGVAFDWVEAVDAKEGDC
jgi:hypothetical protein